jgi:hypothetical protein
MYAGMRVSSIKVLEKSLESARNICFLLRESKVIEIKKRYRKMLVGQEPAVWSLQDFNPEMNRRICDPGRRRKRKK